MHDTNEPEQLGKVASLIMGQSPASGSCDDDDTGMPFLQGCAEFGDRFPATAVYCHAPLKTARAFSTLISVRAPVGTTNRADRDYCIGRGLAAILADNRTTNNDFLQYAVEQNVSFLHRRSQGTTFLAVSSADLQQMPVAHPPRTIQDTVAEILLTTDRALEKTAALIKKHEQIKAGLMNDLFTRGLDSNGNLRPPVKEAPEFYRQTELGVTPREWTVAGLESVIESLSDGPFGSNLKTEHYSPDGGVRVVRLQNVQAGHYDDSDRAFISAQHARYLEKHSIKPGDVLIAGLGDDAYPVGRACLYPCGLGPAINKADCFRLRGLTIKVMNRFLMYALNTYGSRVQIERYKQGVTRQRINTTNLRRILVALPGLNEQGAIIDRLAATERVVDAFGQSLSKLKMQKLGLMEDLLSGRRPTAHSGSVQSLPNV